MFDLKNNSIIICDYKYKEKILKSLASTKDVLNIKFYTLKEIIKKYTFDYDERTIYYLIKKYNFKYEIAKIYLDNMVYIDENKTYKNKKINILVDLKKDLIENNLLIFDDLFKKYLKNYNIYIIGYDYFLNNELQIIEMLKENNNVNIISSSAKYEINKVHEFENINDEIEYIAKNICNLVINGVSLNEIKLLNVSEEYYNPIKRIFDLYNININLPKNNYLYNNIVGKIFLENYDSNISKTLESIKNYNYEIVNQIINIVNKYNFSDDYMDVKELIINDMKNTKVVEAKFESAIELASLNSYFENEYVFLMNFNLGAIPKVLQDEDYITDFMKKDLDMKSTIELNKEIKKSTINNIKNIKNLTITYKKKNGKKECYPSVLIEDMNLEVIKENNNLINSYSQNYDKLKFACKIDSLIKYGVKDSDLEILNNNYKIPYNLYNNKFKQIDVNSFHEYIKNKLSLSYSSLNDYNKCAFKYYLKNVLKLEKYDEKFMAYIGSIFHKVLETCLDSEITVEEVVNNYIKNDQKNLTNKEKFFIEKLIEEIKIVIKVIREQNECCNLNNALYEEHIYIDKSENNYNITFNGIIDKMIYQKNIDDTNVAIIDYKTGNTNIDLKLVPYGIDMQLPIYLYLAKHCNKISNPKFAGFYLQRLFDNEVSIQKDKSYDELKKENLKLTGYSTDVISRLYDLDNTYENSKVIKSMKVKKDGSFSSYAKVLSDNEIDTLIDVVDNKINEGIDNILNADFKINPKKIEQDSIYGCDFCKFKDICFRKQEDALFIKKDEELEFLRGDINANMD